MLSPTGGEYVGAKIETVTFAEPEGGITTGRLPFSSWKAAGDTIAELRVHGLVVSSFSRVTASVKGAAAPTDPPLVDWLRTKHPVAVQLT